ncbi:hypothetical protein SAMN05216388_1012122 [Halorientalis persicus]|uniref:Uncharacterized protein n=1 Tax=Halorientalis persicus TaxID=1367881 RepID=A0A1H8PQF7_9EURY|nr:hypothetical protein SAMN05216388_1012122 [Halorientalis persicus]
MRFDPRERRARHQQHGQEDDQWHVVRTARSPRVFARGHPLVVHLHRQDHGTERDHHHREQGVRPPGQQSPDRHQRRDRRSRRNRQREGRYVTDRSRPAVGFGLDRGVTLVVVGQSTVDAERPPTVPTVVGVRHGSLTRRTDNPHTSANSKGRTSNLPPTFLLRRVPRRARHRSSQKAGPKTGASASRRSRRTALAPLARTLASVLPVHFRLQVPILGHPLGVGEKRDLASLGPVNRRAERAGC